MIKTKLFLTILVFSLILNNVLRAQETSNEVQMDEMLEMSLEELMNMEVKIGNISGTSNLKLPLSVTTITKEQIELSNSQNILHLIQLYVPGASYWRHSEGPMIGLRGITSDRNNKLLMVVNGIVVNQKAHIGVVSELENWDLEDIEKIEIIRGPGSVTYGPGAIAGVINIVTKSAGELVGFKVSANYVSHYNSITGTASYGFKKENVSGYFYGSISSTKGYTPDGYTFSNGEIGERGDTSSSNAGLWAPAETYMKDFNNEPQVKFLASINFFKENTFTLRYNQSTNSIGGYFGSKSKRTLGFDSNDQALLSGYDDFAFQKQQQLMASLKNIHEFENSGITLESELALLGGNYLRTNSAAHNYDITTFNEVSLTNDPNGYDFAWNQRQNFSENSIIAKSMAIYKINQKHKIAAGVEAIRTQFGKRWGDNTQNFRMGDAQNIINGSDSKTIYGGNWGDYNTIDTTNWTEGENYFYVGNGWHTYDLGFVAEANLAFHPLFNLILSGRADKNTYSDWLLSPRIAVVSELNKNNAVKLIFQQSNKINTSEQLYVADITNGKKEVESISNIELIYTCLLGNNSMLNISGFYNNQDAIGWNRSAIATTKIADVEMAGFEIDYKLQLPTIHTGISHSYTQQLSYRLKDSVEYSLISFSEYYINDENGNLTDIGSGNDLIGISNNTTKLYFDKFFNNKKFIFHTEFAAIWGFKGSKQAQTIASRNETDADDAQAIYDLYNEAFDDYDFFGNSFFWNASFSAKIFKGATLMLGVHNILGGRYSRIDDQINAFSKDWSNNNSNAGNYFIEPRSYSMKLTYQF